MATPGIFISHSHHDNAFCRRLRDTLKQQLSGTPIFLDESEIAGGDEWIARIQHALVTHPYFIVALSPNSIVATWVREETNLALGRAVTDKSRRVIPLKIDPRIDVHDLDQLAPLLTMRQMIDLSDGAPAANWEHLLRVLTGKDTDTATSQIDPKRAADLEQAVEYATLTHEAFAAQQWYTVVEQAQAAIEWPGNERDTTLWVEMADAYERLNRLPDAVKALDAALKVNRQRVDLWRQKAQLLMRQGKVDGPDGAVQAWGQARAHSRTIPAKLELLTEQYDALMSGQSPNQAAAMQTCEHALQLAPNDRVWLARKQGTLLQGSLLEAIRANNLDKALQVARDLTALSQATVKDWIPVARLADTTRRYAEVKPALDAAARITPNDPALRQAYTDLVEAHLPAALRRFGYAQHWMNGVEIILPKLCGVPAGEFFMGSDPRRDQQAQASEQPQRRVMLAAYQIALFPVTVAEYACFVRTGQKEPNDWHTQQGKLDHPVVNVSWHDAVAYAAWLAKLTGEPWRLPTEAEWEKAARGTDGRIYPWGDTFDKTRCNTSEGGHQGTTPVGSYPNGASTCGAQDMAGNVWEWTSSAYKPYPYSATDGRENVNSAESRVLRGGSWSDLATLARAAYRDVALPVRVGDDDGFRLVRAAPGS